MLFGAEGTIKVSENGDKEFNRVDYHNGGRVREIEYKEHSIRIDEKKDIMASILEAYAAHENNEIIGWSVDATKYDPQSLKPNRIIVTTMRLKK